MAYKIIVSPRAHLEIEEAVNYYATFSQQIPVKFIQSLQNSYKLISEKPFLFQAKYKKKRAAKIFKFPFLLYFEVIEEDKKVKILSCFHAKRNPRKRP